MLVIFNNSFIIEKKNFKKYLHFNNRLWIFMQHEYLQTAKEKESLFLDLFQYVVNNIINLL